MSHISLIFFGQLTVTLIALMGMGLIRTLKHAKVTNEILIKAELFTVGISVGSFIFISALFFIL